MCVTMVFKIENRAKITVFKTDFTKIHVVNLYMYTLIHPCEPYIGNIH